MLQKTLLNIEGLARQLDPELDIWSVARPELDAILREKHSIENISREFRERLPGWLAKAPELPGLVHDFLTRANSGRISTQTESADVARLAREQAVTRRKILQVLAGGSLIIPGAIFTAMETGPWYFWGYSVSGMALLLISAGLIFRSLR
jgi:ubiquinone biosynthesis protein